MAALVVCALQTCSQLGQTSQRSLFEQAILACCMCRRKSLGNHIPAIASAVARIFASAAEHHGKIAASELVELLQEEAQRKAAPVSLGSLDKQRWLEMQSDAALGGVIAETFPETESPSVPKYLWDDSGNCGRWESCMSLQRSVVVHTGTKL